MLNPIMMEEVLHDLRGVLSEEPSELADATDLEGRQTTVWYQGVDAMTYRARKIPRISCRGRKADPLPMVTPDLVPSFEQFARENFSACNGLNLMPHARKLLELVGIDDPSDEHMKIAETYIGISLFGKAWLCCDISSSTNEYREFYEAMGNYGIMIAKPPTVPQERRYATNGYRR